MSDVILGHPYSGAIYAYFADQMQGGYSHTKSGSSYYKTLYGKKYDLYIEISLNLLLLYRNVWIRSADNPIPETKLSPETRESIPELGLNFLNHKNTDYTNKQAYIAQLERDASIVRMLGQEMKIPRHNWWQILESAIDEALFSAHKRVPLICSYGRRQIIKRITEIDGPSLEPILPELRHVKFIDTYRAIMGLAIRPHSLDDFLQIKFDKSVRSYGDKLLNVSFAASALDVEPNEFQVASIMRESIENDAISKRYSGALSLMGNFARIIHEPVIATAAKLAPRLASIGSTEGWYAFRGAVDQAVTHNQMIKNLDMILLAGKRGP